MNHETYLAYNKKTTDAAAAHATTFNKPHSIVFGTLSHSHVRLILRAMSSGAKWPIKENSKDAGLKKLQDPEGRWSLSALAARDPNLHDLVQNGLRMDILSWKIFVEEPAACSRNSQALSKSTTLAMRTSEIMALSTFPGAVSTVQAQRELARSFDVVKESVRD